MPLPLNAEEYGQTIQLAVEGRHFMEPASWKIISIPLWWPTWDILQIKKPCCKSNKLAANKINLLHIK